MTSVLDYKPQSEKSRFERLTMGGRRRPMRVRVLEGEERDAAWAVACNNYSGYATDQRRAGERRIPVVALVPFAAGAGHAAIADGPERTSA